MTTAQRKRLEEAARWEEQRTADILRDHGVPTTAYHRHAAKASALRAALREIDRLRALAVENSCIHCVARLG